jgi:eukaryotic-like serine/threonine-protein kinase
MLQFGPFRVLEKIAGGGMAEIFKVERVDDPGKLLALKLIRADLAEESEFREMLIDEAKIASRLDHPNIARVMELHDHEGELGLILQYVSGIDLVRTQQLLRDRKTELPLDAALLILVDALDGLDFAHRICDDDGELLRVVHRDVSPGNVMIDSQGQIRIVDWGIAGGKNRVAKTDTGHVKGKFRYMAPEQIMGEEASPATDIYSASVTFWELLAGERVYGDIELPELMMKVSKGQLPGLERARNGLPRALVSVFRKATARLPERRYPNAAKFATALRALKLIPDEAKARERLKKLVMTACVTDGRRDFVHAVEKVRFVAGETGGLESALLRALEEPDRIEARRVDTKSLISAEAITRADFGIRG